MNYLLTFIFGLAAITSLVFAKPGGHDRRCPEDKTMCLNQGVPTVKICQRGTYVHMMRCDGKDQSCLEDGIHEGHCGQILSIIPRCRECEHAIHGCLKACPYFPVSKSCIRDCKNLIHLQEGCEPYTGCDKSFDGFSSDS